MFSRTKRLFLRPLWQDDAEAVFHAINHADTIRNLARVPWPYHLRHAQEFCERSNGEGQSNFAICAPEHSGAIVGVCGLSRDGDATELGFWITRDHCGKGYATEAGKAVIDICRTIGVPKLTAGHFLDNPASGAVLRKLGFRCTGKMRAQYSEARKQYIPCIEYCLQGADLLGTPADSRMIAA